MLTRPVVEKRHAGDLSVQLRIFFSWDFTRSNFNVDKEKIGEKRSLGAYYFSFYKFPYDDVSYFVKFYKENKVR